MSIPTGVTATIPRRFRQATQTLLRQHTPIITTTPMLLRAFLSHVAATHFAAGHQAIAFASFNIDGFTVFWLLSTATRRQING